MSKKYFQYHQIVDCFLEGIEALQAESEPSDTIFSDTAEDRIKAAFIRALEEENFREETSR
ncbi:MAG: hypothetical protein ACI9FB_003503 [Candidatus Azotimanducaceae bacterium]